MSHSLKILVEEANKVKAECFVAATTLTAHAIAEAKRMEERFLRRYGEDYQKYATLKYEEWVNGYVKSF
jgi:hypothetical protein